MPYIAFDLDAKKRVHPAARAAGVEPGTIAWGLLELWEHVFATGDDTVSELVLDGCFGPSPRIREVLTAFGFLEAVPEGYRVRGAARYLRVKKAQSDAGKKAAGNLKRGRAEPENAEEALPAEPEVEPVDTSESRPALTPSTEHRTPKETKEEEAPPLPKPAEPRPVLELSGAGFFAWAQAQRHAHKLVGDKVPNPSKLGAWYSEAMMELNGDDGRLRAAYAQFTDSSYWAEAKWPFNAFMAQWREHV